MEISSYTGFLTVLISLPALLTAHLIVSKSDESINLIWGFSLLTLVFLNLLIEATNLREGNLLFSHFDVLWFIAAVTLFISTFFSLKKVTIFIGSSIAETIKSVCTAVVFGLFSVLQIFISNSSFEEKILYGLYSYLISIVCGEAVNFAYNSKLRTLNTSIKWQLGTDSEELLQLKIPSEFEAVRLLLDRTSKMESLIKRDDNLIKAENLELSMLTFAHDVRSPIGAIKMAVGYGELDYEKYQNLIENACKRVEELSNGLLISHPPNTNRETSALLKNFLLIEKIITIVINEKILIWERDIIVKFNGLKGANALITRSSKFDSIKFGRIISNLLDNSYESVPLNGVIEVKLDFEENFNVISVIDNGKGIPKKIIENLGKRRLTLKPTGNGLGLLLAHNFLQEWSASLIIFSKPGNTVVSIRMPNF